MHVFTNKSIKIYREDAKQRTNQIIRNPFWMVSLYQLSFTYFAGNVEDDAKAYAKAKVTNDDGKALADFEKRYLDSIGNTKNINLGFAEYSYNDIRDKEMNLGLDLKGGINAILQVSVKDSFKKFSERLKKYESFNQRFSCCRCKTLKNSNLQLFRFILSKNSRKLANGYKIK